MKAELNLRDPNEVGDQLSLFLERIYFVEKPDDSLWFRKAVNLLVSAPIMTKLEHL